MFFRFFSVSVSFFFRFVFFLFFSCVFSFSFLFFFFPFSKNSFLLEKLSKYARVIDIGDGQRRKHATHLPKKSRSRGHP